MVPTPPSGTVTFLFTDVEGSTRQWEAHASAMAAALARHEVLLRGAVERHEGYVFKTVGDAVCASFRTPRAAALAALDAQAELDSEDWPSPVKIRVRMAIHTGICEERDGDYFGPAVNRVARLESVAHGRQILVSSAAAELLRSGLPKGIELADLGEHLLKDIERPERVFQLCAPSLPSSFPRLRSLSWREAGGVIIRSPAFLEQDDPNLTRHHLVAERLTIGRDRDNDVVLAEDYRVSRRHAHIVFRDGQWVLHDSGSSNGTFLGSERIDTHPLRHGDMFRIGEQTFRFYLADDPLATYQESFSSEPDSEPPRRPLP